MTKKTDFDESVALPPGLEIAAIRRAVEYMEKELAGLVEIYFEQANVFSAIVGIFGTKALDSVSNYEKHRHADMAQQRFPDLRRRGSGANLSPRDSLESKGSKRPWAIQPTTTIPGGTWCGDTSSTRPRRVSMENLSSSGAWTSCFWASPTGSTRKVLLARVVAGGPTRLARRKPPRSWPMRRSIAAQML